MTPGAGRGRVPSSYEYPYSIWVPVGEWAPFGQMVCPKFSTQKHQGLIQVKKIRPYFFGGGSQRHSKTMSPGTHKNTFSQIITKALKRVKPQPRIPRNPIITGKIGTQVILPQNSTIFQTQHALKPLQTLSF